LTLAVLTLAVMPLRAQEAENLDDLFSDPVQDTVVVETQTDHLAQYATTETIQFSGSFNAEGGIAAGWTSWPVFSDLSSGFDSTIALSSSASLNLDARPDPDFRLYGSVTTEMDPLEGAYTWSSFTISELFVDYTWLDDVFIRLGKHGMAWGQARLFKDVSDNGVTDLMADAAAGYSLRANLPTIMDGISLISLINQPDASSYTQIVYAGKADKVLLGTMFSLGARYQIDEGVNALLSVKRVVLGIDLLADAIVHYDADSLYPKVLAGFFKEWPRVKLYGEYYYNGAVAGDMDHSAGLAWGFNNIAGTPVDLGLRWIHTLYDSSGSVIAGLTWKPWKYITASLALPVAYGPDGSRYVSTTYNEDVAMRRLVLAFGLEMAVSF
jgi:hypothetical protein